MAWFSSKVSLGGFPDIAGAVNKLQESVKNIEKNFDSALGFEEKEKLESANEGTSPAHTLFTLLLFAMYISLFCRILFGIRRMSYILCILK